LIEEPPHLGGSSPLRSTDTTRLKVTFGTKAERVGTTTGHRWQTQLDGGMLTKSEVAL